MPVRPAMNRRQRYGQHFLTSGAIAARMVELAGATASDVVLEVGTGRGALTALLCERAKSVVSFESDGRLYEGAERRLGHLRNLDLRHGDGFTADYAFDIFVSNLPYSQSRRAVEWMAGVQFKRGAVMIQEEFFRKISDDGPSRRAVSIIWQEAFAVTDVFRVGPRNFDPPPRVGSVALRFEKRRTIPRSTIRGVHRMFSARRRVVDRVGGSIRRLDDLSSAEVLDLARAV